MQWTHLIQTIHLQMICGMVTVRPGTRVTAKIPDACIQKAIQDHARIWKSETTGSGQESGKTMLRRSQRTMSFIDRTTLSAPQTTACFSGNTLAHVKIDMDLRSAHPVIAMTAMSLSLMQMPTLSPISQDTYCKWTSTVSYASPSHTMTLYQVPLVLGGASQCRLTPPTWVCSTELRLRRLPLVPISWRRPPRFFCCQRHHC